MLFIKSHCKRTKPESEGSLPVLYCGTVAPFSNSDHDSLVLGLAFQQEPSPVAKSYNFAKANYPAMNIFLASLDWPALLYNCLDVNAVCQTISDIVSTVRPLYKRLVGTALRFSYREVSLTERCV